MRPCSLDVGFSRGLGIQEAGQNGRHLLPFLGFFLDLFAARSGELVKLRFPIVIREAPLGRDVALLFQLEQSWIERSVVDRQKISAGLLDPTRDAVAM